MISKVLTILYKCILCYIKVINSSPMLLIEWLLDSFIHAFIHAYVHSCIHSFIHPFIYSFIHWINQSTIHSFIEYIIFQIYKKVGTPLVDGALNGFNGALFAYGQSGSGKLFLLLMFLYLLYHQRCHQYNFGPHRPQVYNIYYLGSFSTHSHATPKKFN